MTQANQPQSPKPAPPSPMPTLPGIDLYQDRPRRSLNRVISLFVGLMAVLVVVPGILSIWYSYRVSENMQAMRLATQQSMEVSNLQMRWLSVIGVLESISTTKSSAETQLDLASRLSALEVYFSRLSSAKIGLTPEMVAANQQITQELIQVGVGLRRLSGEIYDLTTRNRWSQAANRRQEGLLALQKQLDSLLSQLNKNIEADLQARTEQVEYMRRLSGTLTGITAVLGISFAIVLAWLARQRIQQPMQQLTRDVQRITRGDFSPVTPLTRSDEIGDLSLAIATMTEWLRQSYEMLEQRVAERTQEVERRRVELQVAAQVARDIASTHNLEALLNLAVNLIKDRYKFYHAGIFLNDDRGEYAVLRSATGEAGRALLAREHKLRIGQIGLVGFAAQSGEPRLAMDVGQDAAHFRNPLLPETRSEAAIPLKTSGRVIGVLDVQSTQPNAFDAESLQALQVLADQLATAIQNARLLEEVQQNLSDLQVAYGQVDQQAWARFTQSSSMVGYQYDGVSLAPITPADVQDQNAGSAATLSIPLQVRGTRIGSLDVWSRDQEELSEADTFLLANISSRLSQILESARLFEEAQSRAMREQLINRLTATITRSLDTDGVLRAAAYQLGELPAVMEATVLLASGAEMPVETAPDTAVSNNGANGSASESQAIYDGGGNGHRP